MSLLPWQQENWAHLQSYVVQRRIPQALLVMGGKGYGKQQLATEFAQALLCTSPQVDGLACGLCNSCLLFVAATHPDFLSIQPEETSKGIGIEQVRTLISKLNLKPQFNQYRVIIINPADALNTRAVNAFLKCLEEPAERSVIMLITDRPAKLPATILSRCQKMAIKQADPTLLKTWLRQQNPLITSEEADILLALTQYAPLQALAYAQQNTLSLRNECFKAWVDVAKQQVHPVIVAENWQKLPVDILESQLLAWLCSWVMDIVKCRFNLDIQYLTNRDLLSPLQEMARRSTIHDLYSLYDILLVSRQRLDTTVNKQCIFEEILIHWSQINQG